MITTTTLIVEALERADDFMTMAQIVAATGRTTARVNVALHHLKKHRAIDAMAVEGRLYWYGTPETDSRCKQFDERVEETEPRHFRPIKVGYL